MTADNTLDKVATPGAGLTLPLDFERDDPHGSM